MTIASKPEFWFMNFGNDWLEQLHELFEPTAQTMLPWWPQGGAVYLLLLMLGLGLALLLIHLREVRRAAKLQQQLLLWVQQTRLDIAGQPEKIAGIATVLKRFILLLERAQDQPANPLGSLDWYGNLSSHSDIFSRQEFDAACRWAYLPPALLAREQVSALHFLTQFQQLIESSQVRAKLRLAVQYD